jgi:protein phosphatase
MFEARERVSITISIPRRSLVVLIGLPGCGKSTFARRHFRETAIVSSDLCRKLVSDSEDNQVASPQAFDLMAAIMAKRMALGRLVVADAMHLRPGSRGQWLVLARQHGYPAYAIVLDVPAAECIERDAGRPRRVGAQVILDNVRRMAFEPADLLNEGFAGAWRLGMDVIEECEVRLTPAAD